MQTLYSPFSLSLSFSLSSSRTRRSGLAILIQTQPRVAATDLRVIAITRRGATGRAGRDDLGRLDALSVGVPAAVAPESQITESHQSLTRTPQTQDSFLPQFE